MIESGFYTKMRKKNTAQLGSFSHVISAIKHNDQKWLLCRCCLGANFLFQQMEPIRSILQMGSSQKMFLYFVTSFYIIYILFNHS
jgi:hypothetical protein